MIGFESLMDQIDTTGLTIAIAVGGLLAALGAGIDALLLTRHAKVVDSFALRWWFFFDDLRVADIPRTAVSLYILGKNKVLGRGFTAQFFLRSFLLSLVLTTLTVPGGRALGLYLLLRCNLRIDPEGQVMSLAEILAASWSWTGGTSLAYLVPVNVAFDLATIFVTIVLLSAALSRTSHFLIAIVIVDICACFILFYNAIYIADQFDSASKLSSEGYWNILPFMLQASTFGCSAYHFLTSKLLYVSTILIPTLVYLIMIVALFALREGFVLMKFFAMYLLEKSVEDKKTIFAHVGTSLGLVVATGKAVIELVRLL